MADLSEKQQDFVARTKEHLDEMGSEIVTDLIGTMVKEETPFLDVNYIIQRAKAILMAKMKAVKFKDEKITDARRNRLFESICQAKEVHVEMELGDDEPMNEKIKRNEDLAQGLIAKLIDPELLFSDQDYLDEAIENDDQLLLAILVDSYLNRVYEGLLTLIQHNERKANEVKWGKTREEITWKDLDKVLTKKK